MGTEEPKGAPGQPGQTPLTTPTEPLGKATEPTPSTTPKVELKDGAILIDGKKYVKESDLLAAKESLQKRLDEAQSVHSEAVDKLRVDLSAAQTSLAQANAKVQEAEQARKSGAISTEELAKVKQEAEDAKRVATEASVKSLELRRVNIILRSGGTVTEEQLKNKTAEQLDSFEEALKVLLSNSRGAGPGNYAIGGGATSAAPASDMDRARALIAGTPQRGTRTLATKTE